MVMTSCGAPDAALRERLPALWRAIEDAHYVYLETDDSPDKLQQRKKLEGYIMEYLSLVPHECKFGLAETGKVFQRTVAELPEFSAYRAGIGWAALARYAGNLLAQPWRREYRTIRLYCGYYKHEVEANMVGSETLLQSMGYKPVGGGKMALDGPVCPDMVAAISRDALIAACECQIMCAIWEAVWGNNARVTWAELARERARRVGDAASVAARLTEQDSRGQRSYLDDQEIYSNVPVTVASDTYENRLPDIRHHNSIPPHRHMVSPVEEPIMPVMHPPYMIPTTNVMPANVMYQVPVNYHPEVPVTLPQCNPVPMVTPYRPVPYYYPVQSPYMMPTPVYAPIRQAATVPVNGAYPYPQYRYPTVPTGQLIELESPSVYENGKYDRHADDRGHRKSRAHVESSRRNSTSKSGFSDVSLPSLPRSDTQPALSKAREDGMGTYESWDYVFRNLSSKDQPRDQVDGRSRYSPSLDRDSRTLDRLDREERRAKYQPTTLDLEDGLQALNLDRSYDEDLYRTAKVNENLMRLKQEQELKRAKQLARRQSSEDRKKKHLEPVGNPGSDGLLPTKVAPDKVRLISKKDVKERKEIIKQQNGTGSSVDLKKLKKPLKIGSTESDKCIKGNSIENGVHSSKSAAGPSQSHHSNNYDLKTHLVVTLDETDSRKSPVRNNHHNGDSESHGGSNRRNASPEVVNGGDSVEKWECGTCTYLNKTSMIACEMCGKSKKGPQIQPLTSGGRECPTCTLVNKRDAKICDACGTSLDHCPTYI